MDAHLDVRPLKNNQKHSGSPFRLMLEDRRWPLAQGQFVEFGSQGSQCSLDHVRYAQSKQTKIYWLDDLHDGTVVETFESILNQTSADWVFVSFDLDVVRGSDAPVSQLASFDNVYMGLGRELCFPVRLISQRCD